MKKLKIMFASVAFLFAIVAAFASKNASSSETLVDYYRQTTSNECQVENICDPFNLGDACEYTVYQETEGTECQQPILAYKPL
tara:strand:+ start:8163 stop:8411 length:249 start_codon:yes stop_codon:yes gene_type:complete